MLFFSVLCHFKSIISLVLNQNDKSVPHLFRKIINKLISIIKGKTLMDICLTVIMTVCMCKVSETPAKIKRIVTEKRHCHTYWLFRPVKKTIKKKKPKKHRPGRLHFEFSSHVRVNQRKEVWMKLFWQAGLYHPDSCPPCNPQNYLPNTLTHNACTLHCSGQWWWMMRKKKKNWPQPYSNIDREWLGQPLMIIFLHQ